MDNFEFSNNQVRIRIFQPKQTEHILDKLIGIVVGIKKNSLLYLMNKLNKSE